MPRVEKTVFISYRRTNLPWALAIYQNLTIHGFDVFFDYESINSNDFEKTIIANVRARVHFLVILTPSAVERFTDPSDWMRREIEAAIDEKRNIIPLFLEGFSFGSPLASKSLKGKLTALNYYNGLVVPADYFEEAMNRLRDRFLSVPVETTINPLSKTSLEAAVNQKRAADTPKQIKHLDLAAQEWFEKGFKYYEAKKYNEAIRCYSESLRLQPDYAVTYNNRGLAQKEINDLEGAISDYNKAIRLQPDLASAYNNRGEVYLRRGEITNARMDFERAIQIQPDFKPAIKNLRRANSKKK